MGPNYPAGTQVWRLVRVMGTFNFFTFVKEVFGYCNPFGEYVRVACRLYEVFLARGFFHGPRSEHHDKCQTALVFPIADLFGSAAHPR